MPQRIHIVGRRNHGKTTLVVELVEEFSRRGMRVGTIKHSRHAHDLDTPGKDSYRHRQAGGRPAAVVTPELIGVFLPRPDDSVYQHLAPFYADRDLVVVEGDLDAVGWKVEVWRAAVGGACLAGQRDDIIAVVSDDQPPVAIPVWPRGNIAHLADQILARVDFLGEGDLPAPRCDPGGDDPISGRQIR